MRLFVFGGSFDPVHDGHVAMANAVQMNLNPDLLLWVPSFHAPHKQQTPPADANERAAMVAAVASAREGEELCTLELERGGYSFMVDTLRQLAELYPAAEVHLLLGADSLDHLLTWRDVPELFERVTFVFVPRPGWGSQQLSDFSSSLPEELSKSFHADFLDMPEVPISSTEIRAALAKGVMPAGVPKVVKDYIVSKQCYGFTKA